MPLLALIVSNEDRDVRVLREVLHELHVETEVCSTAGQAGSMLIKRPVDAVLLDADLPGALAVIDGLTKEKGVRRLDEFDRKPVMQDFFDWQQ